MKQMILAAIAMVAISIGLGAAQPAAAALAYGQQQQTGPYAAGGTANGYLGGN